MLKRWTEAILQNVFAGVLMTLIPAAATAYLASTSSRWITPILLGLLAAALSALTLLLLRKQIGIPVKRVTPNLENIEGLVQSWLNNFRVSVKNDPVPEASFRVFATMDSGVAATIGRPRGDFGNYIIIRSDVTPTKEELEHLNSIGNDKANLLVLDINLELARLVIGHSAIGIPLQPFNVFKRVPITEELTEHVFIAAFEDVEAAINAIRIVFRRLLATQAPPQTTALTTRSSQ